MAIGEKLANGINGAIENFPAKKFADTIDVWVQGIWDMLVSCLDNIHWDDFGEKIKDPLRSCPKCTSNLTISKAFYKTGKYMIINLYRKNDMMKLEFFKNLTISGQYLFNCSPK